MGMCTCVHVCLEGRCLEGTCFYGVKQETVPSTGLARLLHLLSTSALELTPGTEYLFQLPQRMSFDKSPYKPLRTPCGRVGVSLQLRISGVLSA